MKAPRSWIVLLAATLTLSACGSTPKPVSSLLRAMYIRPEGQLNEGRPLYVVVRTVDEQTFLTDTYGKISEMVTARPLDESVLKVILLWPGKKNEILVEVAPDKSVGVYGLFTQPGNQWKLFLQSPVPSNSRLRLVRGSIVVDKRKDKRAR